LERAQSRPSHSRNQPLSETIRSAFWYGLCGIQVADMKDTMTLNREVTPS
jgi:hypothetical protein